jgi:hypothetical protein
MLVRVPTRNASHKCFLFKAGEQKGNRPSADRAIGYHELRTRVRVIAFERKPLSMAGPGSNELVPSKLSD